MIVIDQARGLGREEFGPLFQHAGPVIRDEAGPGDQGIVDLHRSGIARSDRIDMRARFDVFAFDEGFG